MQGTLIRARLAMRGPSATRITNTVALLLVAAALLVLANKVVNHPGQLSYFLQILTFGVADGAIYALVALGYTMVYGIIELINFAHGDVFTLGSFISFSLLGTFGISAASGSPQFVGELIVIAIISMVICAIVNVTIERVAYRPLRNAPRLAPLITAIGMSSVLEGLMYLWRGPFTLTFPDLLPEQRLALPGGASIGYKDIIVILFAVVLMVGLTLFIGRSKLGKAMRATAQDRDASYLMGIDVNLTIAATFFIGAVLAGAGGFMYGLYFQHVSAFLGFQVGLIAFTAAVFGGIGNIPGAALGGLVIGVVYTLWDGYFDASWTEIIVFAILILTLVFRPTGLLGMRVPEK